MRLASHDVKGNRRRFQGSLRSRLINFPGRFVFFDVEYELPCSLFNVDVPRRLTHLLNMTGSQITHDHTILRLGCMVHLRGYIMCSMHGTNNICPIATYSLQPTAPFSPCKLEGHCLTAPGSSREEADHGCVVDQANQGCLVFL